MATLNPQPPHDADWEQLAPPAEDVPDAYRIDLPVFEGPLDLLLHLIRKHEIDIFDIPVALVLDKYMAYLDWMRVLNLDIAGEFLVMASTLAQIKSRMLLPPGEDEDDGEEEEEGDPREELVRRLLAYQKYKEAAEEFRDRPILDRDVFTRGGKPPPAEESDSPFADVSVFKLIEALDAVIKKARTRVSHNVLVERVSIADRIQQLAAWMLERGEATFTELFEQDADKMMIIVTFMAMLEMARLRMIRIHQPEGSEVIYVRNLLEKADDLSEVLASSQVEE